MSLVYFIGPKVLRIEFLGILAPNLPFSMQSENVDNEIGALRKHETVDSCCNAKNRLADYNCRRKKREMENVLPAPTQPKSTSLFTSRKMPASRNGFKAAIQIGCKWRLPVAGLNSLSVSFITISTYFNSDSFSWSMIRSLCSPNTSLISLTMRCWTLSCMASIKNRKFRAVLVVSPALGC